MKTATAITCVFLVVILAQGILSRGAGLAVVWPQFIAIALIGATFFDIALARFRRTIGSMT